MNSSISNVDDFELTNCPDPKCYICTVMPKGGYPSAAQVENGRIKLNPYHKQKLSDALYVVIEWLGRVA